MIDRLSPAAIALLVFAGAAATIAGAWIFELGFGLLPCPLCLEQRWPYYIGMPLALLAAAAFARGWTGAGLGLLGLFAIVMLYGVGLGIYHSGVEWHWWEGPAACAAAGSGPAFATDVGDLIASLNEVTVPSCTEAAWRFLGLSLAGYNVLLSLALAALAVLGVAKARSAPSARTDNFAAPSTNG